MTTPLEIIPPDTFKVPVDVLNLDLTLEELGCVLLLIAAMEKGTDGTVHHHWLNERTAEVVANLGERGFIEIDDSDMPRIKVGLRLDLVPVVERKATEKKEAHNEPEK